MDCKQVIERLLDLVEGDVSPGVRDAIRAHLEECERCRTEFERIRVARRAVGLAVDALAPRNVYATERRIGQLMEAAQSAERPSKIFTFRRLVASAAAAAILVSVPFIVQDLRQMWSSPAPATGGRDIALLPVPMEHLVLASDDQVDHIGPVRPVEAMSGRGGSSSPRQRMQLASLDTEGVRVPVDHDYYDAEEAALWW